MTTPKRATRSPANTSRPAAKPQGRPGTKAVKRPPTPTEIPTNPWNALWAMLVGFFMILVDSTIVSVANPTIMVKLGADYDAIIWVTSAYLLAYAVPLLVAGRLGTGSGRRTST